MKWIDGHCVIAGVVSVITVTGFKHTDPMTLSYVRRGSIKRTSSGLKIQFLVTGMWDTASINALPDYYSVNYGLSYISEGD